MFNVICNVYYHKKKQLLIVRVCYLYIRYILSIYAHRHSGSVVERPLCDREVVGSIPGRVIPKSLKRY